MLFAAAIVGGVAALIAWGGPAAERPTYQTSPAEIGDLTVEVSATGTLQPLIQVDISSELSGVVRSVAVTENQKVRKGDVLAVLDTARLAAQIERAEASVTAAKAKIADARTTLSESERAFSRAAQLSSRGMVADQARETAEAARDRAQSAVAMEEANLAIAEAELKLQQADLEKSTIYAPIDGMVLTRSVDPGQTVASSLQAPVLFVIAADLAQMELKAAIDEADIGGVRPGQDARFTVDAFPERRFSAEIRDIAFASVTTEGVVTYDARLDVDNRELLLRPGMTATVAVVVRQDSGVLTVPAAAFRFRPAADDGTARLQPAEPAHAAHGASVRRQPRGQAGGRRQPHALRPRGRRAAAGAGEGRRRRRRADRDPVRAQGRRPGGDRRRRAPGLTRGMSPLIAFERVWKTYGHGEARVDALAGVDLEIERGAFVAIMGPSGSGKSTAMNIIGCLDTPSAGRHGFGGIDAGRLDRGSRAVLRNLHIGFVFQGYNLLPRTTAAENVELPLSIAGCRRRSGGRARSRRSPRSAWPGASITSRRSCPAASSSAWRSPGRS